MQYDAKLTPFLTSTSSFSGTVILSSVGALKISLERLEKVFLSIPTLQVKEVYRLQLCKLSPDCTMTSSVSESDIGYRVLSSRTEPAFTAWPFPAVGPKMSARRFFLMPLHTSDLERYRWGHVLPMVFAEMFSCLHARVA